MSRSQLNFSFDALKSAYESGDATPEDVIVEVHRRIDGAWSKNAWLHVPDLQALRADARALAERRRAGASLPLYGLPFAVKDNIDVAGHPTTVACPALSRVATESAPAVQRLVEAGAIVVG